MGRFDGTDGKGFNGKGFNGKGFDHKGFDGEGFETEDAGGTGLETEDDGGKGFDGEGFETEDADGKDFDGRGFDGTDGKGFNGEDLDGKGLQTEDDGGIERETARHVSEGIHGRVWHQEKVYEGLRKESTRDGGQHEEEIEHDGRRQESEGDESQLEKEAEYGHILKEKVLTEIRLFVKTFDDERFGQVVLTTTELALSSSGSTDEAVKRIVDKSVDLATLARAPGLLAPGVRNALQMAIALKKVAKMLAFPSVGAPA